MSEVLCEIKVVKGDGKVEQRIVMGEVYVPNMPDSDGEYMDAATIEKMAHDFIRKQLTRNIDVQHDNETVEGVQVVESFIARKGDPDFIPGSWVLAVHVNDDDTWGKIKKGEINGFSLEAYVSKVDGEVELDVPPVITGNTSMTDDHKHAFYASYDPSGNFLGGRTSMDNGHMHTIKRGTVTEDANGHRHKFSFVERLLGS